MELTNTEYQEIVAAFEGCKIEDYFDWDVHLGDWCGPIGFAEFCKRQTECSGQGLVDAIREAVKEHADFVAATYRVFDIEDSILGTIAEFAREMTI